MKFSISLFILVAASFAVAQDCCKNKTEAKQGKTAYEAKAKSCGMKAMTAEEEFLMEAEKMSLSAEGKMPCCKSTPAKVVAKGDAGCCNAAGESAKFKVFVAGKGYQLFGCEGSAGKGRKELIAKGEKVGAVQKVNSKSTRVR